MRYCDHGHVHISNTLAENAIRSCAVGRKAWLFADTTHSAHVYLLHLLNPLGTADTLEKIEALLPWNVAQAISQK